MKCLAFDIWGKYGHFRKFYTTSSPLTFAFPPRTALIGLLSSILGINKNEYINYFSKNESQIGISLIKPVKKSRISYNLIDTKSAKLFSIYQNHTQVTYEVLMDCAYKIYFTHNNEELYQSLKEYLINHKSFYTPCLGLSEFIANFKYDNEYEIEKINNTEFIYIHSIVPFQDDLLVKFEDGKEYFKDTLPNEMKADREVIEFKKFLYEKNGYPILCNMNNYFRIGDKNIVFL